MKKLLAIGMALVLGLSACNPLDYLEPIPVPLCGWTYVQAKTIGGEPLCGLYSGGGIALESAVNDMLTAEVVEVPAGVGASVKVKIETTLPNITLLPTDVTHYYYNDVVAPFGWADIPLGNVKVEQEEDNFVLTFSDATGDYFKIIYCRKVFDLDFFTITIPQFSQEVEVIRLSADPIELHSIHVKGEGLGLTSNDPCFTGFQLKFL